MIFRLVSSCILAVASICAFWVEEFDNPVIRELGYFFGFEDERLGTEFGTADEP